MRLRRWIGLGACVLFLLLAGPSYWAADVLAQQPNLDEAIKAVVRIRGCNMAGCNVGLGSGVIIHPSGVILTANHVTLTDPRNPFSPRLEDFVIEVTENARQAPQARYRARLIAAKPESDLALLGIYWDEVTNQPLDNAAEMNLPTLASADTNAIGFSDRLHILGYPLAGGSAINYIEAALGGFDENGALLKVQLPLSEGNSGGPVLIERNGQYVIAGVVIRGRGERLEVGVIRSIDQLHTLTWEPAARRVWADNVQINVQGEGTDAQLQVSLDIHALDFVNSNGRLLVYAFDAATHQPWQPVNANLARAPNGQLVLRQDFSVEQVVASGQEVGLSIPLRELGVAPDQLLFRLLLWDADQAQALWVGPEWVRVQSVSEGAAQVQVPTATPLSTPTETATSIDTATAIATATLPATPIPTSTATNTPVPTSTATPPLAHVTPDQTATAAFATAEYLRTMPTRTATPTMPTITPTPTPNATATYAFNVASAAATAVALNLDPADVRINPVDGAIYVRVPSGEFMMGSDNDGDNEKPVHRVYLDEFWIMLTEVTNAQYKKCVAASVCVKPDNDSWDKPEQANYPVTDVDWNQASTYAQWVAGRLPTEAEWEKAACGTDGRIYPWGDDEPTEQLLNYSGKVGHTTEVGIYPKGASPYGVLDLAGNVWEWTADWYAADYYASAPSQNPLGPATGNSRVGRGGAWNFDQDFVRCACRNYYYPVDGFYSLGFRVVIPGF